MLMLLWLHVLSENYDEAKVQFLQIYPRFAPGEWMEAFLSENWGTFADYFSMKDAVAIDPNKVIDVETGKNLQWENSL